MSLLSLILTLAFIGAVLYVIQRYFPIKGTVKQIIIGVVLLFTLIWLFQALGGSLPYIKVR